VDAETAIINNLNQRYPKGARLTVRVRTLTDFGAIVRLPDSTPGIIRSRELSWVQEQPDPATLLSEGQEVRVLVLGIDRLRPHPRLELSLRQAERDPWADIYKRYQVGQVLRRKVVSLARAGAFVELEPAVTGFVPLQEVSQVPPDRIEDVLWVGDTVQAVITQIDPAARQLRLSLRQHLIELERKPSGFPLGDLLNQEQRQLLLNWFQERRAGTKSEASEMDAWAGLAAKFPRVLLVDDDPSIRHSLQRLLKRLGHQVETCDNAERAITLSSEQDFDLVLLDHELGVGKLNGTAAAQRLTRVHPKLPVVIVTGINWLAQHYNVKTEARAAGARGALIKPVEFARLHHTLTELAAGREDWDETPAPDLPGIEVGRLGEMTLASEDLLRSLNEKLSELQRVTKAESCVLFHMNLSTRQVSVFAHLGARLSNYDGAKYTLQATPIEQVIHEGQTVYEPDTTRNPQKFQYLDIVNFASCIGLPVKGLGQREYGLFLFHSRKGYFTTECLRKAETAAEVMAALMARKEAARVIQQMQPSVFAGQLGSHLVHELNNRLSCVLNDAQTLAFDYNAIEQRSSNATVLPLSEAQGRLSEMQTCIRSLQENGRAMHKIMHLYLGMVSPENREAVNLNEVIHRAVSILTPIAEGLSVRVVTDTDSNLPTTYGVGVRVEQVLVNVALNAIQHTHLARGGGEVLIQSRFTSQDSRLPLQLRVTDTGPGIHHQHLECIFDLGFSTRREGNGFGLFITRGLVESMGGKISVAESVMTVGTTFLIELPLILPSMEGTSV
jgi:signal transduction histidine kinase/predicted RNA-binding protein with RPS1 domain/DNA-binding NarL/FixJ family response regulator